MTDTNLKFRCLKVRQPIGEFYIASMASDVVGKISSSDVRRIVDRDVERYLGIQRELNPKRVADLKKYVNVFDATFPTAIILAINELCAWLNEEEDEIHLFPFAGDEENAPIDSHSIARVIDGQHRIAGLDAFSGSTFNLNVALFIGADVADQAAIFSTVNLEQTKVRKSLAYDLLDVARTRSPEKTCHTAALALDNREGSPFYKKIKRLGIATEGRSKEKLTQASFVKGLLRLISDEPMIDRDRLLRREPLDPATGTANNRLPFRNLFIADNDVAIAQCVLDYFSAIRDRWPEAWNSDARNVVIARSSSYFAFMRFLRILLKGQVVETISRGYFRDCLEQIDLDDDDFLNTTFLPGAGGEGRLLRSLREKNLVP